MAYCQECGTEVSDLAEFCPDCGSSVREDAPQTSRVEEKTAIETLSWAWDTLTSNPAVIGVFALIGVLWAVAQFVFGFSTMTAESDVSVLFWPTLLVYGILNTAAIGMTHFVASEKILGGNSSLEAKLSRGVKRIPALIAIGILIFFPIVIGFVFFIIPGIYLSIRFQLAMPACFIDGKGPIASIKSSWEKTSGNVGKLFVIGLIITAISLFVSTISTVLTFIAPIAGSLWTALLTAVVSPLGTMALSYVYLENKDENSDQNAV